MSRPVPIILAALLQLIGGVVGIIAGIMLIIGGWFLSGVMEGWEGEFGEQLVPLGVYALGTVVLVLSALGIVAAYGLWKLRKWGGYLAIILSSLALMLSIVAVFFHPLSIIDIIYSGLIIIFVAVRWKRLIPSKTQTSELSNDISSSESSKH